MSPWPDVFPAPGHDHAACVASALGKAEALCRRRGARLTRQRRDVLALVWASHQPIGAYALLDQLAERHGSRPAPTTVYRALEFLQAHGLIHRIATQNAFVGCAAPGPGHGSQFLICRGCERVAEFADERLDRVLERLADAGGFRIEERRVEIEGFCEECRER